jgi:hypothetical protein
MITRLISLGNVIIDIVAKVPTCQRLSRLWRAETLTTRTYQALMWSAASNG